MSLGIEREGLADPLRELCARVPVLGTCAGMIMLDRDHLGVLDMRCERNAFGRQVKSFEGDVVARAASRSPSTRSSSARRGWRSTTTAIEALGDVDGHPIAVKRARIVAVAFHPELEPDDRLHRWLLGQL